MMCLRSVLIFLVLLPFPTAPPAFMILFLTAMVTKLRPCVYCTVILLAVFLSTCNNSFLSLSFPLRSSNGTTLISLPPTTFFPPNTTISLPLPLTPSLQLNETGITAYAQTPFASPDRQELYYSAPSRRCWCDLNAGRLFWPVLRGYEAVDEARSQRRRLRKERERWRNEMERATREKEENEKQLVLLEKVAASVRNESGSLESGNRDLATNSSTHLAEEHDLPELVILLDDHPDHTESSDPLETHIWIPLEPGEIENEDPIEGEGTRTSPPIPRAEDEFVGTESMAASVVPTASSSATSEMPHGERSVWEFLPWFLRRPRTGGLEAIGRSGSSGSSTTTGGDGTTAPPPEVPQSPSNKIDAPIASEKISTAPRTRNPITHWYLPFLPSSSRYDLRYHGIGFVLDFGLGRSEDAVRQEVEEWIRWEEGWERSWEGVVGGVLEEVEGGGVGEARGVEEPGTAQGDEPKTSSDSGAVTHTESDESTTDVLPVGFPTPSDPDTRETDAMVPSKRRWWAFSRKTAALTTTNGQPADEVDLIVTSIEREL